MDLKLITDKFQGRHTTAVVFFSLIGTVFHWFHRLDQTYINFVTVMMGFVLVHSGKESYFESKDKQNGTSGSSNVGS